MGKYFNMTSGSLSVTTRSGKTAIVGSKAYLVLSSEEDRSADILRLVRKGLLKPIGPGSSGTPIRAPQKVEEPVVVAAEPAPEPSIAEPEITPEPVAEPEPEPAEEPLADPVEDILGETPPEPAEETSEDQSSSDTAPRRTTKRRRKRSQ